MKKEDWIPRSTTTWCADSLTMASPLTAPSYRGWSRRMRHRWRRHLSGWRRAIVSFATRGTPPRWLFHPFSLSPTATWVQAGKLGWWAPCIWCALGVGVLVGEDVVIHSRMGGESENLGIHVSGGFVREHNIVTHFAVPLRSAWNNVHHYCATVLPFRSEAEVDAWSRRHAIPKGAVVPIAQVAHLARLWYGKHADPDWEKWSVAQAREIFGRVGLTGPFWALEAAAEENRF
jgi:hypothetical protein